MTHRRWGWTPRALAALAALSLVVGTAACGSSDDSSSTSTAAGATAAADATDTTASTSAPASDSPAFEKYSQPVTLDEPSKPVKAAQGKKITVLICGAVGATCVRVGNGAKEAAEALGYQVEVVDGRSQPSVWNKAFQTAIANKSDGIVLAAVPPGLVSGAMAKAKQAGVNVAAVLSTAGPPPDVAVELDRQEIAEGNAAFIAKDSGGKAKVLVVRDDEFPETKLSQDGVKEQLPKVCPGCEIKDDISFTLALAAQRLPGNVASALKKNPDIDYIVLPFDAVTPFVSQGIREAGKSGQVKIVGVGGDPTSIDALKSGEMVQSFGTPAEMMGWLAMDGLVRKFAGEEVGPRDPRVVTDYKIPQRFVTTENLPSGPTWDAGGFDYRTKLKELWGVQ